MKRAWRRPPNGWATRRYPDTDADQSPLETGRVNLTQRQEGPDPYPEPWRDRSLDASALTHLEDMGEDALVHEASR